MANAWTVDSLPSQAGRRMIITGAGGIGLEAARVLARKGAEIILTARSLERGQAAVELIRRETPGALVSTLPLDLADLSSVRAFSEQFLALAVPLDVLVNNAGVMALPYRKTRDGFEMQFGTNHLGHFALTGLLLPALLSSGASGGAPARVVTVSSGMHIIGRVDFDNLDGSRGYRRWAAYGQSKLANLLFAYELDRRFKTANINAISVGCHPGYAATNLQTAALRMENQTRFEKLVDWGNRAVAQSAEDGALPTVFAAADPSVNGCDYIGPTGLFTMRGRPGKQKSTPMSYDEALARELWEVSERLTGVQVEFVK